jgi:transposase
METLGDIYVQEGTAVGKIAYELSHHTGMSYRWVAKYLPDRLKDSFHASLSKKRKKKSSTCFPTKSITLKDPPNNTLKIMAYSNTSFVNFLMKKSLFKTLEKKAEELETNVEYLVYNAIRLILNGSANEKICQ